MTPNWFIGLPVSDADWLENTIVNVPPRVRKFHQEDLHITVAFLGAVNEELAHRAWACANQWVTPPIMLLLDSVALMGSAKHGTALAALVQPEPSLLHAIEQHQNVFLDAVGAKRETRTPLPHITVARIQRRASKIERSHAIEWAQALETSGRSCTLKELALFTWSKERSERLFSIVARRSL